MAFSKVQSQNFHKRLTEIMKVSLYKNLVQRTAALSIVNYIAIGQ